MNNKRKYLFDILPEPDEKEMMGRIREANFFLQEAGRLNYTNSEAMFIATLRYHIDYFERAINMITAERFTVDFEPPEGQTKPSIMDFPIVPISYAKT